LVGDAANGRLVRAEMEGAFADPAQLGDCVAGLLLERGADEILARHAPM
jgi:hypothetical protein